MGCAQSRIDNEESVARCKDRKNLMREAVVARNAFAAGHSGYSMALKNTGAALSDYAHGETHIDIEILPPPPLHTSSNPPPPPPPPMEDNLPPPPPLPPNFSPASLKRAVTMPPVTLQHRTLEPIAIAEEEEEEEEEDAKTEEGKVSKKNAVGSPQAPPSPPEMKAMPPPVPPHMPESKNMAWDYFFTDMMPGASLNEEEEDDNEIENENEEREVEGGGHVEEEFEPKTPEKVEITEAIHIEHSKTAPAEFRRAIKVAPTVSLLQILSSLDDHFLQASESAHEVSKMLEATRLHYHSNFADNRGI